MTSNEAVDNIAVVNPVSKAFIALFSRATGVSNSVAMPSSPDTVDMVMPPIWAIAGKNYNFVRLAGISGASAVIFGAIGSHLSHINPHKDGSKRIFDTANRFHFLHSLALMGVPMARYPCLTGSLMVVGTSLFSGTIYYRVITGDKTYSHLAPFGAICLIVAWLTLLL